jgi:glycolate oxidase FAD binding subunit
MVVKNVAGLDMGKLLIGSLGTLAVIASVNFKLIPMPVATRSFLLPFDDLAAAVDARNRLLQSYLQPAAIDLLSPALAAPIGPREWILAIQANGNEKALARYEREIAAIGDGVALDPEDEPELWEYVRETIPRFLANHPGGAVARVTGTLAQTGEILESAPGTALARAGSGVVHGCFDDAAAGAQWVARRRGVLEYAPPDRKSGLELWPSPGQDLEIMQGIKRMFDPDRLLNRGRYYRHF